MIISPLSFQHLFLFLIQALEHYQYQVVVTQKKKKIESEWFIKNLFTQNRLTMSSIIGHVYFLKKII